MPGKKIFSLWCLFVISFPLFSQVNRTELEENQGPVIFLNYEGPHARIETREQIRNIGYSLGQELRGGNNSPGTGPRYFVIHSVSPAEGNKLDADIFGLGTDVGVDHIRNLRLIIQGYLEAAYSYRAQDAALLAEYITVYNAVYRGSWAYFSQRYKTAVIQHLDAGRAGISIRFDEWPGQTLMLIPLGTGSPGSLSAVDTSAVSDTNVLDEMRKEDNRGIDRRQEMADLKDREALEAEQRAQGQREAIADEEERIAREREAGSRERERIEEERQENRQAAASGEINREEEQRREEELAARQTAAERKEQELEQREEGLAERREEARQDEELAGQKREEALQDRESIARDQQEIAAQDQTEPAAREQQGAGAGSRGESPLQGGGQGAAENSVIGTSLERPDSPLGRVVRVNSDTGAELRRSRFNTVNSRTLAFAGGRLLAIAGEDRGNNAAIRLVEIDTDSLEIVSQGNDNIHPDSLLWINGTDLYAITVQEGGAYLGRFDTLLARQARSEVPVHPFASVNFQNGILVTQRADGSALLLDPTELREN
ncbi:MAG: hypothetical protein LBH26_04130 [Treponema sp.]|jgi:hypothetical protein|nr:hypothetical protein [Treponema sp.]